MLKDGTELALSRAYRARLERGCGNLFEAANTRSRWL
jgi:hypothetical protein